MEKSEQSPNATCANPACKAEIFVLPATHSFFTSIKGVRHFFCSPACQQCGTEEQAVLSFVKPQ